MEKFIMVLQFGLACMVWIGVASFIVMQVSENLKKG